MTLQFVSNDEFDTGRVTRWGGLDTDNRFFSMYIYISQVHKLLPKVMKLSPARGASLTSGSLFLLFFNPWKTLFPSSPLFFLSRVDMLNNSVVKGIRKSSCWRGHFSHSNVYIFACVRASVWASAQRCCWPVMESGRWKKREREREGRPPRSLWEIEGKRRRRPVNGAQEATMIIMGSLLMRTIGSESSRTSCSALHHRYIYFSLDCHDLLRQFLKPLPIHGILFERIQIQS